MAVKKSYKKKTYETIDNVVKSVCMDLGEGEERYEQYLHWALKESKNWYLDFAKEICTRLLPVNSYLAVDLPEDYVDWTKVGLKAGNQILTFVHDDFMSFPTDNDLDCIPDKDEDLMPDDTDAGYYYYNLLNDKGQDLGKLWGLSVKDNFQGYFRINEAREQIQFRTKMASMDQIYLEYISNGYDPCGLSYVHPYVSQLIELYIHWQRLKHQGKNAIKWQVDNAKNDYWVEFDKVQSRYLNMTAEDYLDVFREGFILTPLT